MRTDIVQFNFNIYGRNSLSKTDQKFFGIAVKEWLEFFIAKLATLDNKWCGGHFGHNYVHLLFCGDRSEAKNTFLNEFEDWKDELYDLLGDSLRKGNWGLLDSTTVYRSWYDYM